MYACFTFLVAITIWSAFVGWIGNDGHREAFHDSLDDDDARKLDRIVFSLFFLGGILTQLSFAYFIVRLKNNEDKKMTMRKIEIEKHIKETALCCQVGTFSCFLFFPLVF